MKRILALLLTVALCFGLAACGGAETAPAPKQEPQAPAAPAEPAPEAPAPEATEAPAEEECPYQYLTEEEADDYFVAILKGEVTGLVADFLANQNEDVAKLYLDFLAGIFGPDPMSTIQNLDSREQDQILAEAVHTVSAAIEENDMEQFDVPEVEVAVNDEGMPITMTLYSYDLNRSITIHLKGENAFMEPDWAMITDFEENYFLHVPSNYEMYTLQYGALDASTEDLISSFVARRVNEGKDVNVSEIEYFNAGGYQWEIFTLSYEQTTTGIDKDTGKEVTLTSTVYNTTCFARLSSDSALQLMTDVSVRDDIAQFYKDVVTSSIDVIDAGAGVG